MEDTITPNELADELGIDPKRLREFLRKPTDGRETFQHLHQKHWHLIPSEADRVRAAFGA